jgi:DNA-binding beta-propeller fold protein YncE
MDFQALHRALAASALFAIAGCAAGAGSTSPAAQPLSPFSLVVHRGMPFAAAVHHSVAPDSAHPAYKTRKSLVFEGDQTQAAVNIYATKKLADNPAPIATIHVAAGCPYGLAADKTGTIYVADNCGGNDVEEYAKGSTTLKTKITNGISNPLGLAIDTSGTLYVSNYPASITEYPFGTSTPSKTITGGGLKDPFGLALDAQNNLYIADFGTDAVYEVAAGTTTVTNLNLQDIDEPLGVAIDKSRKIMWVTDGSGKRVEVYQLGSTTPFETITGFTEPYAISIENTGKPHGAVVQSDLYEASNMNPVYAYKPGQYTSYAKLTNGLTLPTGLLITKP